MRPKSLLILTAVMIEAKAVTKALQMTCPKPGEVAEKLWGDFHLNVAITGVSAKTLPDRTADLVVMAGLAGALDPHLLVADLVIDDWMDGLKLVQQAKRGKVLSTQRISPTPQEKAALFAQTGCLAVDMENAIVRNWAINRGMHFCAIRAISDRADQSLDPAVLNFVDPWGRARILPLVRLLLRRPSLLPHLVRVGVDSKKAANRLGQAVREMVDCLALREGG